MKPLTFARAAALLLCCILSLSAQSQVKPALNPKEEIKANPAYDLQGVEGGFLLPRVSHEEMMRIQNPVNGLMVFNATYNNVYQYNEKSKLWVPLNFYMASAARAAADSCEWSFDSTTNRVYLYRGLAIGDSIYYNVGTKKFVFTDNTIYGNSLGQQFPVESFSGKFYFKGTASLFADSANLNPRLINVLMEVDNDNNGSSAYGGISVATVANPSAMQRIGSLEGANIQSIHAGQDTASSVIGANIAATASGHGFVISMTGLTANARITDSLTNNVISMTGIRSTITRTPNSTGRVLGNVFGYVGAPFGFVDSTGATYISGNHYGIFLNNITGAAPKRNYAFYSNKGHNRFADSTLITDGFFNSPRAVLDINATSAMIIPSGTTVQRPATGITAMLRYNTNNLAPEFFNGTTWNSLASGTNEWRFDSATNRVNLVRGLPLLDSIFYSVQQKKFVFADRMMNTNSMGQDFPVTSFNGKYIFKSTASRRTDTTLANGPTVNIVYEVDQSADLGFPALTVAAVANPKRLAKFDQIVGISSSTIHAGKDTGSALYGIQSTTTLNGDGAANTIFGISSISRVGNLATKNVTSIFGMRSVVIRDPTAVGTILGNAYVFHGSTQMPANSIVSGNAYGLFLSGISGAAARKNYAIFTAAGINRFGDSVIITNVNAQQARAILDVNATSAMIVPTGTTAQRPATGVTGMVRYNTTTQSVEAFSGTAWNGIVRGSVSINIPSIAAGSGTTMTVTVTNATTGSVVSVSPDAALSNGIVIAWARVSAANTVQIRFENNAGVAVDPPATNFLFRVIQ